MMQIRYRSGIEFHFGKGFLPFIMFDEERYDLDFETTEAQAEAVLRVVKSIVKSAMVSGDVSWRDNIFDKSWKEGAAPHA